MLILREAFLGVGQFEQFLDRLPISRAVLTDRLSRLVAAGVLDRDPPDARRATYRLSLAGADLAATYSALSAWGTAWLPVPDKPAATR